MLKLNVNQEKQLTFEVQIGGVQSDQVSSHLRIEIDDVEYGFPATIGNESITVNLPPLRTVTSRKLKEGEEVQVKLEIVADGNYLTPWTDTFHLSNPLVVEAKIIDDEFNPTPAFKTKLVQEGHSGEQKQGVRLEKVEEEVKPLDESLSEEDLTERIVNKLAEKLAKIDKQQFDKAEKLEYEAEKKEKKAEKLEKEAEKDEEKAEKMEKGAIKESKLLEPLSKNKLLEMTEEDVYAYMDRAGTKNQQVQKIVYNQAESKANSSKPVNVLMEVVKILKHKKD